MRPLISVIIPTYQHAKTLPKCLDSILAQSYQPLEVIVVNDGSTDATEEVLKRYQGRIQLITQVNQGANVARNSGLMRAQGELVIFCDADVVMKPDMLAKLFDALTANPGASYAYSGFWFGWKHFNGITFSPNRLRQGNFVHTTSLVRKNDFPGFDPAIKRLQDWDVWLTMLENNKTGVLVPETLFAINIHGASRIGTSWLPAFMYKIPWKKFGWQPEAVTSYNLAKQVIVNKHHL